MFDIDHRHPVAHVVAGEVQHPLGANAIQRHIHLGRAGLLIKTTRRADQLIARDNQALFQQYRVTLLIGVEPRLRRNPTGLGSCERIVLLVDRAILQRGGGADDFLGLHRILHAGELNDHAVGALLLDHRLGHAQLVDAVAQRGDVLLERGLLQVNQLLILNARRDTKGLCRRQLVEIQALQALIPPQDIHRLVTVFRGPQQHEQPIALPPHRDVADALITQRGTNVIDKAIQLLAAGRLHIDLHQEVHTTLQVQAQGHGFAAKGAQPVGCRVRQVQRHHVLVTQALTQRVRRLELFIRATETVQELIADLFAALVGELRVGQRVIDFGGELDRDLKTSRGGDLQSRIFAIQIWKRVQRADRDDKCDQ